MENDQILERLTALEKRLDCLMLSTQSSKRPKRAVAAEQSPSFEAIASFCAKHDSLTLNGEILSHLQGRDAEVSHRAKQMVCGKILRAIGWHRIQTQVGSAKRRYLWYRGGAMWPAPPDGNPCVPPHTTSFIEIDSAKALSS